MTNRPRKSYDYARPGVAMLTLKTLPKVWLCRITPDTFALTDTGRFVQRELLGISGYYPQSIHCSPRRTQRGKAATKCRGKGMVSYKEMRCQCVFHSRIVRLNDHLSSGRIEFYNRFARVDASRRGF